MSQPKSNTLLNILVSTQKNLIPETPIPAKDYEYTQIILLWRKLFLYKFEFYQKHLDFRDFFNKIDIILISGNF